MSLAMILAGPREMPEAAKAAARRHLLEPTDAPAPKAPEISRTEAARGKLRSNLPEMPDGWSAEMIADWLGLPSVTAGKLLFEAQKDGLVRSRRIGADARRWYVCRVPEVSADVQPSLPGVLRSASDEMPAEQACSGDGAGGDREDARAEPRGDSCAAERVVMLESLIREYVATRKLTDKASREACSRAWACMVQINEGRL